MSATRVGLVTTSYPRTPGDGDGGFVAGHAEALAARGLAVEVIAAGAGPCPRDLGSPVAVRRVAGEELFYRGGAPDLLEGALAATPGAWGRRAAATRAGLAAAAFSARLALAVARAAPRWDRVVAHWLAPSALAALAALPARGRLLAIAHGGDVHTLARAGLLGPALRLLRRRGARLAFVSRGLLDRARAAAPALAGWLDEAAIVQPMGIDLARFRAIAARRGATTAAPVDGPPVVLCLARLVPQKGVDVLVEALRRVAAPHRLVVAGDGPLAARLAAAAPGAAFLGRVDAARRDALLAAAAVVALPSRRLPGGRTEGTPLVALEALAAGVPVVASAVGGLAELPVALVPPDDPDALAAALRPRLADPPRPPPAGEPALPAGLAALDWARVADRLERHAAGTQV